MFTYEPIFAENIFGLDLANLDSKSENFTFNYYLDYMLHFQEHMFSIQQIWVKNILPTHCILTNNPIIGYIFGKKELKENICLHVSGLSVAPAYRNFKFGSQLMTLFEENGNTVNAWFSDLHVRQSNTVAVAFYKKLGYVQYRTIYNYYTSPNDNAIDMRKSLKKDPHKISQTPGKNVNSYEIM